MIAEGTAGELKGSLGKDVIELKVSDSSLAKAKKLLVKELDEPVSVDTLTRSITLNTSHGANDLLRVAEILKKRKIHMEELSLHRPSLDDVFLAITGDHADEEKKS